MTRRVSRTDRIALVAAAVAYATLSAWMAVASRGFLEADGITHFLARRFALSQPVHFVSVWSRPLCVLLYCVPAFFGGLTATRLTSLLLVLLTVPLTIAVARRLGLRRPAWAGLFLLTQPLLFAHSFSELTEVPFALLLAAAFYAYQRRWFGVTAVIVAVAPLGRPEGFGLLAVAAVALVLHRRFVWLIVLPAGVLAWEWVGWHVFGGPKDYAWWQWLGRNWPYSPDSVYGHGSVFTFVGILPAVIGPIAFGFVGFGAAVLLRFGRNRFGSVTRFFDNHRARCRAMTIAIPVGVLAVHSLLWATGKMASNGEPRYLLVAAPFWAVLTAAGLERIAKPMRWRRPLLCVAANAALAVAANLSYPCFPLAPQDDDLLADTVTHWLGDHADLRRRYPRLYAWQPHLFYELDIDKENSRLAGQPTRADAGRAPPGTLLVWDSVYSVFNSSADYVVTQDQLARHGWRPVWTYSPHPGVARPRTVVVYVSPKDAAGRSLDTAQ